MTTLGSERVGYIHTLSVEKQSHFRDIVVIIEKFSSFRFNACSEAFTMIGGEH